MLDVLIICLSGMILLLQLVYGSLIVELYQSSSNAGQVSIRAVSIATVCLQVFLILYLIFIF